MSPSGLFVFWIFLLSGTSGYFDANFTLQNIWARLPSAPGLRSMIQCVSSDTNTQEIKFSRKINTGQGTKLPKRSRQFLSGKPVFARIFLMPGDDKLTRFGAFQCRQNRGGISTEIVTLKLPPEELAEVDAAEPYIVANQGDDVELEVIVRKEQNLTLKWRHDGKDEIPEWDNQLKIQLTNVQENNGGIYECYYDGRRSESLHAILRLIVRGCPAEFYGKNCENQCPPCYNGGICHDKWGVCVCPAGFKGENCEQACGGNHFGADCSKQCTPPQEYNSNTDEGCALHLFCKPDPYGCSCAPGFKGPKCMDHCLPGWYGADCKQPCHCAFGVSSCNRITGACDGGCARGWRGTSCQIEDPNATPGPLGETTTMAHCPIGHYGPSCEKDCHCTGNEYCDIISGYCPSGCEEGWGGESCSACNSGRFGDNCEKTCHCEGGDDNCDKDGYCLAGCKAGWAGFTCEQECTAGRFGVNCASVCHCKDGPSACDRVAGVCTGDCLPGFMGRDCQTMCPRDTYGINCVHACTCLNGGQCSRIDGSCSCEGRWRGTICNESEPQIIAATDDEINVGQQAFISCTVDAIPAPTMNITSDMFPSLSFHFRKLEQNQYQAVAKVRSSNAGDIAFSCTARNKHGFDHKIVTLSVIAPPRLLKEPELQSSGNTSLVVKWDEWMYRKDDGGKDDDTVEYLVIYRKIGAREWVQVENWKTDRFSKLENLEPDTEYQVAVKCRRHGKGGEGEPGPLLNVKTDCGEPLPDAVPQLFIPETITSTSVKLTWKHPPESQLKCTLIEYKLEYYLESTPSDIEVVDIPDVMDDIELGDLAAHSVYVFHLFPVTLFGQSKYFAELIIRTTESLPGPVRNVTCTSRDDAEKLEVMWEEPLVTAGVLKGYNVTYQLTNRSMCWTDTNDDLSDNTEKLTAFSTDTQLTLVNLHPYSTYLVSVQAMTSAGKGNATSTTGTTAESSPDTGPPNLRLKSKTSTSLEFEWDPIPCEQANGKLLDYEYTLVTSGLNELGHHTLQKRFIQDGLDDNLKKVIGLEVLIEDLEPHKEYGIAVRGNTDAGAGPFSEFLFETTKEDVPPSPNLLEATPANTSLTLSWSVPNPPFGELIFYRLKYYVSNEPGTESYLTLNTTSLKTKDGVVTGKILGLQPSTEYMIKVQASTNAGWGKWSDHMRAKTLDGVPGPPSKVSLRSSTRTSLEISWEEPVQPNGAITGYEITYGPQSTLDPSYNASSVEDRRVRSEGSLKRKVLENLHPSTQYSVKVSARTVVGYGPPTKENFWTIIAGEHVLPSIQPLLSEATNESVPITFSTVGKTSVEKYQIIVEDSRNKHGINEDLLRGYQKAVIELGLPYYIAAELDSRNLSDSGEDKFVVGDKKVYGGYENVHLNPGHQYRIRIRTLIKKDQGTKSLLSEPQEFVSGDSVPPEVETYSEEYKIFGMYWIWFILIVASASVLLISTIFIISVCVCRKRERRKKVSRSERDSGISESMTWSVMYKVSETEAVDGPLVSEGYKVMHGHDNCAMSLKKVKKDSKTSIGIKVENLPEYVHNATSGTRLCDEFSRLAAGQTAPWTVARRSDNLKKNRYGNILPYDRHRVVLHFDQNGSGSDYINASYIDGYRRPKEYIVTQGPLECTVNDFWRMIWQESVPVIIMVTELIENGKTKCVQYWPDDSMVCGKLQILLIHCEQNTNFVIRTILMRSVEEGKTHRVHQYQFTEWPDKTIPTNPCFLIKMMKRIRNDHPVLGGPMVVHCSAGAGRSGTFVALDALTQQAEEEKRVDIFRYVNCSRLQRINLVQSPEQYVFIHEALLEAIRYEDTSIPLEMIPLYLKELNNSHGQDYISTIQRQYETLNKTQKRVDINLCSAALSECNIFKNRDPLTVPADSTRIRLESRSDDDDYINAVKVNGYRQKDAFLVTQMPLQNTIEDFWDLVHQNKSSLILMLNGCDTEDCLNIGQYWPSRGQATYGSFEVQVVTFEDQGEVIIRIMRLINHEQPHSEPQKVIQLQYKVWTQDLPPGPDSMLNLLNTVELWYSRSSGGPITVHCLDGATRCGLFCAVSYVCGQVRAEESLDVYQMAKDIRINRPEFLSCLEQYKFCFEVAQELAQYMAERNNANSMSRKKRSCYV